MTSKSPDKVPTPEPVADSPPATPTKKPGIFTTAPLIAAMVGVLALGGIGGFLAGMHVGKSQGATAANGFDGQSQNGGPGGMRGGRGMMGAMGTVTAVSSDSITISDQMRGSTATYKVTDSTTVTDNGASASLSDIAAGDQVMVRTGSTTSSDANDSQTATSIMLNPSFGGPGGMNQSGNTSDASGSASST